jgi:outer membrane protein OmpA-like peptidoglycan-associated protein
MGINRICILFSFLLLFAGPAALMLSAGDGCKTRLPDVINGYQPSIVPVSDIFGRILYFDRKLHPENTAGAKDLDEIWMSENPGGNVWTPPVRLPGELNTPASDVLFSLSPSGDCALVYGKYSGFGGSKEEGFSIVRKMNGQWGIPRPLDIEDYYNLASQFYGSLSHDGQVLLMALERRDGLGKMDIYVSFYNKYKKNWTEPMNLGDRINTAGMEATALLAYDNRTLYFASSGRGDSFGKMDLYMSRRLDETWRKWSRPRNLGKGINTAGDDSSLWPLALADTAFLVSYDTANARDGIYTACIPDSLRPLAYRIAHGAIFKGKEKYRFPGKVQIEVRNENDEVIRSQDVYSGKYAVVIPADRDINLVFSAIGYDRQNISFPAARADMPSMAERDLVFVKTIRQPSLLDSIVFSVDSHTISGESQKKLRNILNKHENYPNDEYVVSGHADQKGSDAYNMLLSMKRARSAAKLLMKLGVPMRNIEIKWHGESRPASENDRLNRRVEIYIINNNEQ